MRREVGFTLIEVLVAMSLAAILMTLGAFSLRQYWLTRSLGAATGEVTAQLRTLQQSAASESSPFIFGAAFTPDSSSWITFRYSLGTNTSSAEDDSCTVRSRLTLGTGVRILTTTSFATAGQISQGVLSSGCGIASTAKVVAFFPKGTATAGRVDLRQPSLGRSAAVCVSPLTARTRNVAAGTPC